MGNKVCKSGVERVWIENHGGSPTDGDVVLGDGCKQWVVVSGWLDTSRAGSPALTGVGVEAPGEVDTFGEPVATPTARSVVAVTTEGEWRPRRHPPLLVPLSVPTAAKEKRNRECAYSPLTTGGL
jgi:hypothetical protein